jgi:hypothetical protein
MPESVNTETVGLTKSHDWITVALHDICYHINLPEREDLAAQDKDG